MQFDPANMGIVDTYRLMVQLITPRPIAWVSTVSKTGVNNLAPYSFFNGIGANPPSVLFCPVNRRDGSQKDSLLNVLDTRAVSYTHLRAHETLRYLVCRLLLEK